MARDTIGGIMLTDHDLVAATSTSRLREFEDAERRLYIATFSDGTTRLFAVGHAEAARVYATEYAARIIGGGVTVTDCRWHR